MAAKSFAELLQAARASEIYKAERVRLQFVADLLRAMEARDISRADLARKLGKSNAYVTKILRGDANFTVQTMIQLCEAVGTNLHVHMADGNCAVRWFDLFENENRAPSKEVKAMIANDYEPVNVKGRGNGDAPYPVAA